MRKIFYCIKEVNKQRFLIYLFSFAIYWGINVSFSNAVLYLLGEESFRQGWTDHSIPCGDVPNVFLILFQGLKIVLFAIFMRLVRKNTSSFLSECLVAYFLYDLVYILSFVWDLIPFPIHLNAHWMLYSSGQVFLWHYFPYLDLIFAGLWTLVLFLVLYNQNRLSFEFLIKRLVIIPLSVPLVFYVVYFVRQLT